MDVTRAEVAPPIPTSAALTKDSADFVEYVLAIQEGDVKAFEDLYQISSSSLKGIIRSLERDPALAEDLLQETYELIWTKIHNLREPATFWAWARRIAINLTLRRQQQAERRGWRRWLPLWFQPDIPTANTTQDIPERLDLQASLSRMPVEERALIVLRESHGLSYEELSESFSKPIGTVKSRLHTARKKILRHLQQEGASLDA